MGLDQARALESLQKFTATLSWERIPYIIQRLILKELANHFVVDTTDDRKYLATYAAVCLECQEFFENVNFSKLVLQPSALKEFETLVKRRQSNMQGKTRDCPRASKRQNVLKKLPLSLDIACRVLSTSG